MPATFTVQLLDENNDPVESSGGPVFIHDLDAVAQVIACRIRLLQGEWWEDLAAGFPFFQQLEGSSGSKDNQDAVLLIIQQTILGSPYVLSISDFSFSSSSALRFTTFRCECVTQFGTLTVTNAPGSSAQVSV